MSPDINKDSLNLITSKLRKDKIKPKLEKAIGNLDKVKVPEQEKENLADERSRLIRVLGVYGFTSENYDSLTYDIFRFLHSGKSPFELAKLIQCAVNDSFRESS